MHFIHFKKMFFIPSKTIFTIVTLSYLLPVNALDFGQVHYFVFWYRAKVLNPFPNKPWLLRVYSTSFLKTLWEKIKLLVTSNLFFSNSLSTLLNNFLPFSSILKLSSANSFNLEESKICCFGKG